MWEPINLQTASPVLLYCLAREGYEQISGLVTEFLPYEAGWDAFKNFVTVPSDCPGDVTAFQGNWVSDTEDAGHYEVVWVRQLTGPPSSGLDFQQDRQVGVRIGYVADEFAGAEECEIWSDDFADLESFFTAVEAHPMFDIARRNEHWYVDVFAEEPER